MLTRIEIFSILFITFQLEIISADNASKRFFSFATNRHHFDFQNVINLNKEHVPVVDRCPLRIVGGVNCNRGDVPYQVAIRRELNWGRQWYCFCGGSIVTHTHIISAAHCFDKVLRSIRVIAGTIKTNVELYGNKAQRLAAIKKLQQIETWRSISGCHRHAKYNRHKISNDLAVLEVARPFSFESPAVKGIPMMTKGSIKSGTLCLASGYGTIEYGLQSESLRMVCLPVVNFNNCRRIFGSKGRSDKTQICAGVFGKDSCRGDSGGPLACNGVLVGIVSFGSARCGDVPGVYTLLSGYTTGKKVHFLKCDSTTCRYSIPVSVVLLIMPQICCIFTLFML